MRDLKRELDEFEDWPPAWRPEPGDVLVGKILRYDQGHTDYGPVRTVIVETDAGDRLSVWLSSTVLLNEFARLKPKVGERIGIKYLGMHAERGYHRWRLVVDREEDGAFTPLGGERNEKLNDEEVPF